MSQSQQYIRNLTVLDQKLDIYKLTLLQQIKDTIMINNNSTISNIDCVSTPGDLLNTALKQNPKDVPLLKEKIDQAALQNLSHSPVLNSTEKQSSKEQNIPNVERDEPSQEKEESQQQSSIHANRPTYIKIRICHDDFEGFEYTYICPCGNQILIQLGWIMDGQDSWHCGQCGFVVQYYLQEQDMKVLRKRYRRQESSEEDSSMICEGGQI